MPKLAQQVLGSSHLIHLEAEGPAAALMKALRGLPGVVDVKRDNEYHYLVSATTDLRAEVASAIVKAGGRLFTLDIEMPSLDDIYASYFQEVEDVVAA